MEAAMPDENEQLPPEPEVVVEPSAEEPPQQPAFDWERKDRFRILGEMRKVVNLTISATEAELTVLRRKLNKLTYGS
jgi:hypothetical protein